MKKAAVISAMVLAAALSFQGTWAREPVAGEAAPVSEAAYTYDNKVSGLTMVIPGNRVENEKSSPAVYQAFLPDEGISLSISFGYATKYKPEEKISSIITDSDSNMYNNKITESAIFKKNTIIDFRNALENKHSMTLEDKLRTKKICDVAMIEMGIKGDE